MFHDSDILINLDRQILLSKVAQSLFSQDVTKHVKTILRINFSDSEVRH